LSARNKCLVGWLTGLSDMTNTRSNSLGKVSRVAKDMPYIYRSQIHRFLIAAIFALVLTPVAADSRDPATRVPYGWTVYSTGSPGGAALRCANFSRRTWSVSLDGETPRISAIDPYRTTEGTTPEITFGPSRRVAAEIPFENGRLVGFNNGEFGGGLWWISVDRTTMTKIWRENVRGLVHTSFGTLALVGLDHLSMRSGKVLRLIPENPNPPSITILADLREAPRAFSLTSDGAVVVVTGTKILRINSPGTIETLFSTNYFGLSPNSVALSSGGTIYVGMRHFVTRLAPFNQSYEEDWLVPTDCAHFEQREYDCHCLGQGSR
jgi:hypothetical protein